MSDDYDWADDAARCYELAYATIREREIRAGRIKPSPDRPWELEWQRMEGLKGINNE